MIYSKVFSSIWYLFLSDELRETNSPRKPARKNCAPIIIEVSAI